MAYISPQAWSAFERLARVRSGESTTWGDLTLGDATQLASAGLLSVSFDGDRREIDLSFTPMGEAVADRCVPRCTA